MSKLPLGSVRPLRFGLFVLAALVPLFGLAPETGLAISILRRARDIAIGVPVLLIWQLVEARRARR